MATGNDSRIRLGNVEIVFQNNLWFDFGAGNTFDAIGKHNWESAYLNDGTHNNKTIFSINR